MSVYQELMLHILDWSPVKLSSFVHIVACQEPNVGSHIEEHYKNPTKMSETNACKNCMLKKKTRMLKFASEFFLNIDITTETIFMIHLSDLCSLLKVLF